MIAANHAYHYVHKNKFGGIDIGKVVTLASIEALLPERNRDLEDLTIELTSAASRFAARLHPLMRAYVGDLVRSMNCYYSNLIEGHNTLRIDIDRAMMGDFSGEPEKRNLAPFNSDATQSNRSRMDADLSAFIQGL